MVQAIAPFDQYLEKYPKHGSVSMAKVHRGLAEMRQPPKGARLVKDVGDHENAL